MQHRLLLLLPPLTNALALSDAGTAATPDRGLIHATGAQLAARGLDVGDGIYVTLKCETSAASPRHADMARAVQILEDKDPLVDCLQQNPSDSLCTQMKDYKSAGIAICGTTHPHGFPRAAC